MLGRSGGGIQPHSSPGWAVPEVRYSSFRADVTFAQIVIPQAGPRRKHHGGFRCGSWQAEARAHTDQAAG